MYHGLARDTNDTFGGVAVSGLLESGLRNPALPNGKSSAEVYRDLFERGDAAGAYQIHTGLREANISDDFPILLSGNMYLRILEAFQAESQNWRQAFPSLPIGTYNTYKVGCLAGLAGVLPLVREGGHYDEIAATEYYEQGVIAKYGELFAITREALRDDNKRAFAQIPQNMGVQAAWTVNSIVADVLESATRTLVDGSVLFVAGHSNIQSTGTALSMANLKAECQSFMGQPDIRGVAMGLFPDLLIVPAALELTARELLQPALLPTASSSGTVFAPSPGWLTGRLKLVVLEGLTDVNDWYLALSGARSPIEVGFMDGRETPEVFMQAQDVDFDRADGIRYKCRIEVGAYARSKFGIRKITGA